MGSVPNCRKQIAVRYPIRWFKCKLKPPKNMEGLNAVNIFLLKNVYNINAVNIISKIMFTAFNRSMFLEKYSLQHTVVNNVFLFRFLFRTHYL